MKLLSMKLNYFKGIQSAMFEFPDGGNYTIYGTNGAGKTTIVDALTWLLFDKDSTDAKDFGIKTIMDGKPLHHAEHSVECVFNMENGQQVTLKKVFKEKWQKPRGKLQAEFAGHTTEYYIDDLGKSATAYKQYIGNIIDEKTFKVLTNPLYFNENLKDAERRAILMAIIGGVQQDVVIAQNPELHELGKLINQRKVEDFREIVKQSLTRAKKDMDAIEPAIKEHQAMMIPGADAVNSGLYENSVKRADEEIANLIRQIEDAKKSAVPAELIEKKEKLEKELRAVINAEKEKYNNTERRLMDEISEAQRAETSIESEMKILKFNIKMIESDISDREAKREEYLKHFAEVKATSFVDSGEPENTKCPTCGQDLPAEKIEEIKQDFEQRRNKFMLNRANALKMINEKGRANKVAKEEAEQKLEEAKKQFAELEAELAKANEKTVQTTNKLEEHKKTLQEITPEVYKLNCQLDEVTQQILNPDKSVEEIIENREAQRQAAEEKRQEAQAKLNDIEQNRKHQARIMELHERETELSNTYTTLKRQEWLCDEYNRKVTDYINQKIADKFKMARFVMFKDNITNDGAKECCEVQVNGVPYHDINKTMKLNIGLDIIQALSNFYLVSMPVFIDNAESYVELLPTNSQIIRLVVSAADKTLRIEKN